MGSHVLGCLSRLTYIVPTTVRVGAKYMLHPSASVLAQGLSRNLCRILLHHKHQYLYMGRTQVLCVPYITQVIVQFENLINENELQ